MAKSGQSPRDFRVSLQGWAEKVAVKADALARQCSYELAFRVVMDTPVFLGFLRGGWQPAINTAPAATKAKADKTGSDAAARVSLMIKDMKAGDIFSMRNNTVYAKRIEWGFVGADSLGRVYNQQGRYFVTKNVKAWPALVKQVAQTLQVGATP